MKARKCYVLVVFQGIQLAGKETVQGVYETDYDATVAGNNTKRGYQVRPVDYYSTSRAEEAAEAVVKAEAEAKAEAKAEAEEAEAKAEAAWLG